MNKKGQVIGFALLTAAFVFIIVAFVTIEPLKENLNSTRATDSLNCPGTDTFNQTQFDADTGNFFETLNKRGTCFVTGISMVWFIGAFLIAVVIWVVRNWRRRPTPR
jgi:hypothetical protein